MRNNSLVVLSILAIVCALQLAFQQLQHFMVPDGWPTPTYPVENSDDFRLKFELGRKLFHEPLLSRDSTVSCETCHLQFTAFAHTDHTVSHGIEGKKGTRNAPSLINLAWSKKLMWDGAIHHIEIQALAPLANPLEMDLPLEKGLERLRQSAEYKGLFYNAFGDSSITGQHALQAFGTFMVGLISANSKYDKYMRGETDFTAQEKNGLNLFRQHCENCHKEPLFTDNSFRNNGLPIDAFYADSGRFFISKQPSDILKFKVPTLRNSEFSYPYMHDGRFRKLSDVIAHYNTLDTANVYLDVSLNRPVQLSENEKVDLIAFLLTLTDREFLFNQNYR